MSRKPRGPRPWHSRVKVISMGASGTGKSCLIKRYCEKKFVARWISTIGVDFGVRNVTLPDGKEVKVNFWDMSGNAQFAAVRQPFYADAQAGMLVYDVGARDSFAALDVWLAEWAEHGDPAMHLVVCANKTDIGARARRVTEDEGRAWARSHKLPYFETSAKDGQAVGDVFSHLFSTCVK